MSSAPTIILRQWTAADLEPFAAMNANAEVMAFFPRRLSWDESKLSLERQKTAISEKGWGLWAVEVDGIFAGFTGIQSPRFEAAFTPCVEIGWRFRREYWGRGIAYAAARAAEAYAFDKVWLRELVSFTATINLRSQRLMERLDFHRNPKDDFLHPLIAEGNPVREHVFYRKDAAEYAELKSGKRPSRGGPALPARILG